MKIILPSFYNSHQKNQDIINNFMYYKNFYGISGNFPFHIMNGSYNNNKNSSLALAHDIVNSVYSYGTICGFTIIDCGNICLTETDYLNCFAKVVFDQYGQSKNIYFSVSSMQLADYLVKTYPKIQLIIHQNYTNFHSEESIQQFINTYPDNIKHIIITPNNECLNIDNISKIYWIPYTLCYCCPQHYRCLKTDNTQTLSYSEFSQFNACQSKKYLTTDYLTQLILHAQTYTDIILFDDFLLDDEETVYEQIFNILQREDI